MALRDTLLLSLLVSTTGVALAVGLNPAFGVFVALVGLPLTAGADARDGLQDVTTASEATEARTQND
jgi:hypothetical protein